MKFHEAALQTCQYQQRQQWTANNYKRVQNEFWQLRLPNVSHTQWFSRVTVYSKEIGQDCVSVCRIKVRFFFQIAVSIPEQFLLHIVHLASVHGALGCLHSLLLAQQNTSAAQSSVATYLWRHQAQHISCIYTTYTTYTGPRAATPTVCR